MKKSDQRFYVTLIGFGTATLILVGGALYLIVTSLSVGTLRVWAVMSAFLLPLVFLAGWRLGTRDARAHLSGLDKGIGAVMQAADKTADLRTVAATRARRVMTVTPTSQVLQLPDPEIVHVKASTDDEVIDL